MKRLLHLLLALALIGTLSWTLWRGYTKRPKAADAEPTAETGAPVESDEGHEAYVVTLEKEKWKALGVEMMEPEKSELATRRTAYGRVLDPTPLVTLESDLAGAEAALTASRAENSRTQRLLAAGENASRKSAETAEAQFRSDEIKLASLKRQARLQWGDTAVESPEKLHEFAEALVRGTAALIRVDLLPADAVTDIPTTAKILILGREQQPIETRFVTPAAEADPRTQAQSFILQVSEPPFPLRPGMALTAWLELPGVPRSGFTIPRSAILRHDGRTWVVEQEEEEKFVRKPVTLDSPVESGWFVEGKEGGLKEGDLVVVTGAQALLSEELKAAGGAAEEE